MGEVTVYVSSVARSEVFPSAQLFACRRLTKDSSSGAGNQSLALVLGFVDRGHVAVFSSNDMLQRTLMPMLDRQKEWPRSLCEVSRRKRPA